MRVVLVIHSRWIDWMKSRMRAEPNLKWLICTLRFNSIDSEIGHVSRYFEAHSSTLLDKIGSVCTIRATRPEDPFYKILILNTTVKWFDPLIRHKIPPKWWDWKFFKAQAIVSVLTSYRATPVDRVDHLQCGLPSLLLGLACHLVTLIIQAYLRAEDGGWWLMSGGAEMGEV